MQILNLLPFPDSSFRMTTYTWNDKIARLDIEILNLINERSELLLRKQRDQKEDQPDNADQKRLEALIQHAKNSKTNNLDPEFLASIYRQMDVESARLLAPDIKLIAFQGEHGAYGESAALAYGADLVRMPCAEFADVFTGVKQGLFDYGIVPVENSLEGPVSQVNNLLAETDLKVVGEIWQPIHHSLQALPGCDPQGLRVVYSHPQALAQCRNYLTKNKLEARPFYDTAGAARMLTRERPVATAIIANRLCASIYNLNIQQENIEDDSTNATRFLVLAKTPYQREGSKCSLVFTAKHEAGSLFQVLKIFAEKDIDLTRITSLPIRHNLKHYSFFLDFIGSDQDPKTQKAIDEVRQNTVQVQILGCYPRNPLSPK
jgi:prephenate dehydratase/chorismate mutase/prephenate dehydratase